MALTKATYSMVQGAPLNVLDFGAVGDGTTDDTAAIQAAFDVGGAIVFPSGYTFVSSKLSITKDVEIFGYDSILLHKANSASTGVGLLEMLTDNTLIIRGLRIDGNGSNQTATYSTYNMVWCSIGSMELYECWIGNSKGHAVRTGNIDDFDASKFAHDIIISNCKVIQSATSNQSGDCIRVERTRGDNLFVNNYVHGGLSGMRSQLYCRNLKFYNNDVGYSWADVGITAAMSENIEIIGNTCHDHFQHGFEIDAVVNCRASDNKAYGNGKSGFISSQFGASAYANEAKYWGSIAGGYGTDYSNQTYTSPQVPNISTQIVQNVSFDNDQADRLIGLDNGTTYAYNYVNNYSKSSDTSQITLESGTLNLSSATVTNNTIVCSAIDTYAIGNAYNAQLAVIENNTIIGNKTQCQSPALGTFDANATNKYLKNPSLRSAVFTDVVDATSILGSAVAFTGTYTAGFSKIYATGPQNKLVSFVARCGSGTETITVSVNLYDEADVLVTTLLNVSPVALTTSYQRFSRLVPTYTSSAGCYVVVEFTNTSAGQTIYFQEVSLFCMY